MRSLASAAGVSVRTLYNLFETKDAIVRALASDVLEELDALVVCSVPVCSTHSTPVWLSSLGSQRLGQPFGCLERDQAPTREQAS